VIMKIYFILFIIIFVLSACLERSEFAPVVPQEIQVKSISLTRRAENVGWCIRSRNDIRKILEFLKTQKDGWFIWPEGKDRFKDFTDYPYGFVLSSNSYPNLLPQFDFGTASLREIHGDTDRSVQFKSITPEEYKKLVQLLQMDRPNQYPKGIKEGSTFTFCE